jgi:hypothetical protein
MYSPCKDLSMTALTDACRPGGQIHWLFVDDPGGHGAATAALILTVPWRTQ